MDHPTKKSCPVLVSCIMCVRSSICYPGGAVLSPDASPVPPAPFCVPVESRRVPRLDPTVSRAQPRLCPGLCPAHGRVAPGVPLCVLTVSWPTPLVAPMLDQHPKINIVQPL